MQLHSIDIWVTSATLLTTVADIFVYCFSRYHHIMLPIIDDHVVCVDFPVSCSLILGSVQCFPALLAYDTAQIPT